MGPAWPKAWRWRYTSEHRKAPAPHQDTRPAHFSLSSGLGHHTLHEALIWTQAWEGWKVPALSAVVLTQQGVTFEESN